MKSIAIASLFVLAGTTAQAEIICTDAVAGRQERKSSCLSRSMLMVHRSSLIAVGNERYTNSLAEPKKRHHDAEFSAARLFGAFTLHFHSKALPKNPPDWNAQPHSLLTAPTC